MMDVDLTQWDRNFRRTLIATAVIFGLLDYWFSGANAWFRAGFVITVAGLVGYFTNFLAIKMLFQPKQGQVLGWQGLVPKNKNQIARSLGESVQQQLLSPEIILAYIRERELIESGTNTIADWVDRNLQDPEVRTRITRLLVDLMKDRGPDALERSMDYVEEALKAVARNPEAIDAWWQEIRAEIQAFLQSRENRVWLANNARNLLQQEIPRISDWLNRALENYLREKRRLGSVGLGIKNIFSFDQDAISQILERFASDEGVSDDFMTMLDAIMDELQRELESPDVQQLIQARLETWIDRIGTSFRDRVLPALIRQTDEYFSNEANWHQIEETLIRALQWTKQQALSVLNSETGQPGFPGESNGPCTSSMSPTWWRSRCSDWIPTNSRKWCWTIPGATLLSSRSWAVAWD